MIVSNFEVSVRPKSDPVYYRLQITNLAKLPILFALETHVQRRQDGDPNIQYLRPRLDYDPDKVPPYLATNWKAVGPMWVDTQTFLLDSGMNAVFELGISTLLESDSHWFTILGHTQIRVPPIRAKDRFAITAQSPDPVPVLLNAYRVENRVAAAAIPLSEAKALNQISPEGFSLSTVWESVTKLSNYPQDDVPPETPPLEGGRDIPEGERVAALVDLLAHLPADEAGLRTLNELLARLGGSVRIQHA